MSSSQKHESGVLPTSLICIKECYSQLSWQGSINCCRRSFSVLKSLKVCSCIPEAQDCTLAVSQPIKKTNFSSGKPLMYENPLLHNNHWMTLKASLLARQGLASQAEMFPTNDEPKCWINLFATIITALCIDFIHTFKVNCTSLRAGSKFNFW